VTLKLLLKPKNPLIASVFLLHLLVTKTKDSIQNAIKTQIIDGYKEKLKILSLREAMNEFSSFNIPKETTRTVTEASSKVYEGGFYGIRSLVFNIRKNSKLFASLILSLRYYFINLRSEATHLLQTFVHLFFFDFASDSKLRYCQVLKNIMPVKH